MTPPSELPTGADDGSRGLVTLVNPNFIHPPITPYALDILTTSLEAEGFAVEVVDLTFVRDDWRTALQHHFATHAPLLVGVSIRNTDTIYPQEQKVFLSEHREVVDEIASLTDAPIVAGGVGFSSMPFALVEYLKIAYGVKGAGEVTLCELADRLARGVEPTDVAGLIINDGATPRIVGERYGAAGQLRLPERSTTAGIDHVNRATPYRRHGGVPGRVDNIAYYEHGGLGNILTKNGCPFRCAHCVEPDAKGTRFARRDVTAVVDEIETLTRLGVYDLHTTDSEFNLNIGNTKAVLREIIVRKGRDIDSSLHDLRLWAYCQPAPFDEEFAELFALAGGKCIYVAPDHVRVVLLDGWKVSGSG